MSALASLGSAVLEGVGTLGALIARLSLLAMHLARGAFDARELSRQTIRFLRDALPLALLSSIVVGGVVAMQGLGYVRRYNATLVFGWAAGVSAFRDVGPLLLAFCLSARSGCKNAAELGAMAARERLDAVRALGLDVERVVVLPRLCAIVLVALFLYVPMCALVLTTAFLVARALGGQNVAISLWSFLDYAGASVVLEGALRMLVFGLIIALASCHAGTRVEASAERGARSIGEAVFSSSVLALSGAVVANLLLSALGGAS